MIHLFDPENKFWRFMSKLTDAAIMGILWAIVSIPIITMGAATTAFYEFTLHQVRDTEGGVWKSFWTSFKCHFKKATLLWLITLAGTAFFLADLWAAWNFFINVDSLMRYAVFGLIGCLALIFIGCTFYLYPTLALYDFPMKKILGNSFILAIGNLPVTLTLLVMLVLVGVGIFYMSGLFFFWIALYIFFSSYFIIGVFLKYTEDDGEDGREEEKAPALPAKRVRRKHFNKKSAGHDEDYLL